MVIEISRGHFIGFRLVETTPIQVTETTPDFLFRFPRDSFGKNHCPNGIQVPVEYPETFLKVSKKVVATYLLVVGSRRNTTYLLVAGSRRKRQPRMYRRVGVLLYKYLLSSTILLHHEPISTTLVHLFLHFGFDAGDQYEELFDI